MPSDTGFTLWLTGLPCAGKSTVAQHVAAELIRRGRRVEVLDGDIVRQHLSHGLGFSREDRDVNVRRIGFVANLLARNGVIVVVAAVSPYRAAREQVREMLGRFVEIHVDCPTAECERRDVKGMYRQARAGKLSKFTGVDDPYEAPTKPDLVLHTEHETISESVGSTLKMLIKRGYLSDATVRQLELEKA